MGVHIKGMEMPTSCPCELLGIGYDLYCSFAGGIPARVKEYYECCQNGTRPSWCPLVPVPPHGRLIEESKVLDIVFEWCPDDDGSVSKDGDLREMLDEIEALPTIIPAYEEVYDKYTDTAGNLHWTGTHSGEHTIKAERTNHA